MSFTIDGKRGKLSNLMTMLNEAHCEIVGGETLSVEGSRYDFVIDPDGRRLFAMVKGTLNLTTLSPLARKFKDVWELEAGGGALERQIKKAIK